jgi:hypothetical protein
MKSKITLRLSKREFALFILITVATLWRVLKWLLEK